MTDNKELNYTSIADTAKEITHIAAETAMQYYRGALEIDLKSDESPVTVADKQIEMEVRDLLAIRYPSHAILGEEFGSGDLSVDHVWVIDPIDGTRSFISGHPLFGFLLAHLINGIPSLGIISMPALNEIYIGSRGEGATLNGQSIKVSEKQSLSDSILSLNEGEKLFANEPEVFSRLMNAGHTRRFGYDCYPHALLASGHIDVVIDYGLQPFDFLPLMAVIEAAGGIITDWGGNALDFNSDGRVVSAATIELHRELLELLDEGKAI